VEALTAALIAYGWDGLYSAVTMPKKSDTTAERAGPPSRRGLRAGAWLRTGDAAKVLGISRSKVDTLMRRGTVGYRLEPGSTYRLCNPADVIKLLDDSRREVRGEPEAPASGP
jgi:hypothetical protein